CNTGLSSRHLGEQFQQSPDIITKYFKRMLYFFSAAPFYTNQVRLPIPTTLLSSTLLEPHFRFLAGCIGAVDGTHIHVTCGPEDHDNFRNR
ncbi:hypothetical protein BV22DRAFT_980405, partial [Leucogyrophana mollusca]